MANHPSAEKRNRQRVTRTERNRAGKSALRTELKRARKVVSAKSPEAQKAVTEAHSALDRAASRGTIPKKRADRLKSRMARAARKAAA